MVEVEKRLVMVLFMGVVVLFIRWYLVVGGWLKGMGEMVKEGERIRG